MNKLPQITLAFWVMKIVATTLGETAGDFLSMTLQIGYAATSLILISVFVATLLAQLSSTRPFGATLGDVLSKSHDKGGLGFGTVGSSLVLLTVLVIFVMGAMIYSSRNQLNASRTRVLNILDGSS